MTAAERTTSPSNLPFKTWPSAKAREALGNRWTVQYTDALDFKQSVAFLPVWLRDPRRRTVRGVVFEPSAAGAPSEYMNLYKGPVVADIEPAGDEGAAGVARFLELTNTLMRHDTGHSDYVLGWAAHLFQKPAEKPGDALVFRSDGHGVGKDSWFEVLGAMLGPALYANTSNAERDVFGEFACTMGGKLLVKLEEAQGFANRKNSNQLKALVTSETVIVNRRGEQAFSTRAFERYAMTSNEAVPVHIEEGDRCYCIFDVGTVTSDGVEIRQNAEWWSATKALFAKPAVLRAIYDHLMARDLSAFNPRIFPRTEFYKSLEQTNVPSEVAFLKDPDSGVPVGEWVKGVDLFQRYAAYCGLRNITPSNNVHFGRRLRAHASKLVEEKTLHGTVYWELKVAPATE